MPLWAQVDHLSIVILLSLSFLNLLSSVSNPYGVLCPYIRRFRVQTAWQKPRSCKWGMLRMIREGKGALYASSDLFSPGSYVL